MPGDQEKDLILLDVDHCLVYNTGKTGVFNQEIIKALQDIDKTNCEIFLFTSYFAFQASSSQSFNSKKQSAGHIASNRANVVRKLAKNSITIDGVVTFGSPNFEANSPLGEYGSRLMQFEDELSQLEEDSDVDLVECKQFNVICNVPDINIDCNGEEVSLVDLIINEKDYADIVCRDDYHHKARMLEHVLDKKQNSNIILLDDDMRVSRTVEIFRQKSSRTFSFIQVSKPCFSSGEFLKHDNIADKLSNALTKSPICAMPPLSERPAEKQEETILDKPMLRKTYTPKYSSFGTKIFSSLFSTPDSRNTKSRTVLVTS